MLGGGGLIAANVYASATEGGPGQEQGQTARVLAAGAATVDCPDVGSRLTNVPEGAKPDVDRELALLDEQIAVAYKQLQDSTRAQQQDAGFVDNSIMNPLKDKRAATIERIAGAVDRVGERPEGLEELAPCALRASGNQGGAPADGGQQQGGQEQGGQTQPGQEPSQGQGQDQGQGQTPGQGQGDAGQGQNGGQAGNGPVASDYADITNVQPNTQNPPRQADASRGTFSSSCGVNAGGLFNSDNIIVAPGVSNGAHHFHDYVGNQSNNAFSSDDDLANAETSCADQGDKSTYYWPVLRLQNGTRERDADAPGGGTEGNAGQIVTPKQVTLTFEGSPRGKVTAMPRLLRIITGDAKAFVNGPANANASWSCTGFEDRQLKDKYPLCPGGSDVVRTFKFQSCWDGRNIDSANHRTHVAFAAADGSCPQGFQAIPQLVQRIVYDVDRPSVNDGGRTVPLFAVDSFPEQLHKPVTDHGDFINVFDEKLMTDMVDCINSGRTCGKGAGDEPGQQPSEQPSEQPGQQPSEQPGEEPGGQQTQQPEQNPSEPPASEPATGDGDQTAPGDTATQNPSEPPVGEPVEEPADAPAAGGPEVLASTSPAAAGQGGGNGQGTGNQGTGNGQGEAGGNGTGGDAQAAVPAQPPVAAGDDPTLGNQTQPQGGLAETGASLWPAALGAVLVIAGFVVLRRMGRRTA
ncbi:DUF1996 domain-containing protein [Streptomyces sp. NPDC026672]|uniref:DUF1996 domain-containing protein n=1 Tax=unclassified Streptomyces TaxID=2593676 RepID=UPI0034011C8B